MKTHRIGKRKVEFEEVAQIGGLYDGNTVTIATKNVSFREQFFNTFHEALEASEKAPDELLHVQTGPAKGCKATDDLALFVWRWLTTRAYIIEKNPPIKALKKIEKILEKINSK